MRQGVEGVPIPEGFLARSLQAIGAGIRAFGSSWFGPGQPLPSVVPPESQPRKWPYQPLSNIAMQPRGAEAVSFDQLRNLARSDNVLRLIIETRKDQMARLEWTIQPTRDERETQADFKSRKKNDPRIRELTDFFQRPDTRLEWSQWFRAFLEELFVIDAPTIFVQRNLRGKVFSLELMDGSTIKPIIDDMGRIVAYQQWLYGMPGNTYGAEQLFYCPRNPSVSRFYGYSPVEQIIVIVNIALRRQLSQLAHYTIGNIPEGFIQAAKEMSVDQIEAFQRSFDAALEGNQPARSKMKVIPFGMAPVFSKLESLKTEEDEWWTRIRCYAFSINPLPFIKMGMNRSTAAVAQEAALEEGLLPLMDYVERVLSRVIEDYFGYADLCFKFEFHEDVDPQVQSQIDASDVTHGIRSIDEVREQRGLDPIGVGPGIITATGFVPLFPVPAIPEEQEPEPAPAPAELPPAPEAELAAKFDQMRLASARMRKIRWYGAAGALGLVKKEQDDNGA